MGETSRLDTADFEDPLSNFDPPQYASELERSLAEETAEAICCQPFFQIAPDAPICQAIEFMSEQRTACLLVLDEGRPAGVFTERDVLEKVAEQYPKLANRPVREVMTADPVVVYESDPAAAAVAAIAVAGYRHVPVMGIDDRVIGMVAPRRVFEFVEKHFDS